jgi:diguanylate cyclase (GGDEF)-like protein/putative nucleotidyltransferase with HDIG domain
MALVTPPTLLHRHATGQQGAGEFRALPHLLQVYLVVLMALGAGFTLHGVTRIPRDAWPLFLGLLLASTITAAVKVALPLTRGGSTLSLSYVVNFAAMLWLGPSATVPIAIASAWSQCTFKTKVRNPWYQTVFSMVTLGVTVAAAGWAYALVYALTPRTVITQIGAAVVAATVYFLFNSVLVAAAVAFSSADRLLRVWKRDFLWSSPTYYMGAVIAVLAVIVTDQGGAAWVVILAAPAYLTYRSYGVYSERIAEDQRQVREMSDIQLSIIESLALAIDAKDLTSHDHLQRMQTYAEGLARASGMSADEVRGVRTAALLHDIGNMAVPEHILSKNGRLTDGEFDRLKIHPRVGAEILKSVPFPYPVASLVLAHHERWDGRGYPTGLKGNDIPLGARVISVVDCFTAMLADRPYRPARAYAEALATLRESGGSALDPALVDRFVEVLPGLEAQWHRDQARSATAKAAAASSPVAAVSVLDDIAVAHREEHLLRDVGQALSTTLRVSDVVALIASRLVSLVPFTDSALFLYDEASGLYLCQHATGTHQEAIRALTAATTDGLEKLLPSPALARSLNGSTIRAHSVLVAPLQLNQRSVGALVFYHTDHGAFTADHRRLVANVASKAAPIVANALEFERAQEQSLTDLLTGLPNRRSVEQQFAQELARAHRRHGHMSVLLLDMDRFKQINDEFGHQAGDRALKEVAQVLRTGLREYDVCARYAGDEFLLILGDCDRDQAERRRRDLQDGIAGLSFEPVADRHVPLEISVGAATFPFDGTNADDLVASADRRMYQDKAARKAGRGQVADTLRVEHRDMRDIQEHA